MPRWIIGFGFLGARSDHMLAALHTLAGFADNRPIILVGQYDVMLRVRGHCHFDLPLGHAVFVMASWSPVFREIAGSGLAC
jgi:thiamine pyrophosphokinase